MKRFKKKKKKTSKLTKRKVEYFEKTKNRRTISIQTSEWIDFVGQHEGNRIIHAPSFVLKCRIYIIANPRSPCTSSV
jgi:hypothetical protein